jgi:hypothetical protein
MAETLPDLANYQSDHDLIVGLVKDVGHLSGDVGKLTEAVNKKNDDHEGRIRMLERSSEDQRSSSRTLRYILGFTVPIIFAMVGWLFVSFYTEQSTLDARISRAINTSLINYSLIKN